MSGMEILYADMHQSWVFSLRGVSRLPSFFPVADPFAVCSVGRMALRSMHAASVAAQAAATPSTPAAPAPAPKAAEPKVVKTPASSFGEVVQKYGGWYPFLGLAGVIAVSKEVIILNEEFLLA